MTILFRSDIVVLYRDEAGQRWLAGRGWFDAWVSKLEAGKL